jgi:hypothetical protein
VGVGPALAVLTGGNDGSGSLGEMTIHGRDGKSEWFMR